MYEAFFHLERRPFVASPRTDHYFPARSIEQARQSLTRCITRSEGPGAIIGPSGTGKSLLCFVLAKQFRDKMRVAVVQGGRLRSRKSLLQNILFELKQPFRGMDEDELRLQLLDHLESKENSQRRLLLVVDDAHLIRGQVLADVAALCGHVRDGEAVIQLVLAGGSSFEEKLGHPRLESLQQRMAARCYLQALSYDETVAFIKSQIEFCGGQLDQVIAPEAVNALYRASDGVPRLINQVGDHALLLSYLAKLHPVTKAAIEESWADLQQLPTPWQVSDHPAAAAKQEDNSSIIEFGSLEDPVSEGHDAAPFAEPLYEDRISTSVEQNLWTIESGLIRIRDEGDEISTHSPDEKLENIPPIASVEPHGWAEVEESSMPAFAPTSRMNSTSPKLVTPQAAKPNASPASKPVLKRIANPFEEQFEAEEVIQDGFARKVAVNKPAAAPIPTVNSKNANQSISVALPAMPVSPVFDEDRYEQFDGTSVDWMNYQATSVVGMGVAGLDVHTSAIAHSNAQAESWNVVSADGTTATATMPLDDRDAILVENDQPPRIRPVKRQEFRQLFAKMRGDQ